MAIKKDRPVRALFDNVNDLKTEDITKSAQFKEMLKKKTPWIIEESNKTGSVFAILFEINDSGHYIELHRNNWVQALESCLNMYVEEEDYDTCKKITWIIQEVKDKQKRASTKR